MSPVIESMAMLSAESAAGYPNRSVPQLTASACRWAQMSLESEWSVPSAE
jgi:hypothetical protein